ncbi:hypothetical protein HDU98_004503 [Podochytrium sp. JEL0797]|nr:hypothetical protein HDU98_004503 [Podochytrium sp. JEL0797]
MTTCATVTFNPSSSTYVIATPTATVLRTPSEIDALFEYVCLEHPLLSFGIVAPAPKASPSEAERQTQRFIKSVFSVGLLRQDKGVQIVEHEQYIAEAVSSAPKHSRRAASSSSAFSLVFSKKQDDVDVFFNQVRDHVEAVYKAVRRCVKDIDVLAGFQIDYAACLHESDTYISQISLSQPLPATATLYRKLSKTLDAISINLDVQSKYYITVLRPVLYAYRKSIQCLLDSLEARVVLLEAYEDACKEVVKKGGVVERISTSGSARVERAEAGLFELRQVCLQAKRGDVQRTRAARERDKKQIRHRVERRRQVESGAHDRVAYCRAARAEAREKEKLAESKCSTRRRGLDAKRRLRRHIPTHPILQLTSYNPLKTNEYTQTQNKAKQNETKAREEFITATDFIRESYPIVRNDQGNELKLVLNNYVAHQLHSNKEILEAINMWMGLFSFFSGSNNEHHDLVYKNGNKASWTHEILAGAVGFEAMHQLEKHEAAASGKPVNHAFFKELLAGFAAAEVDKLVETHSLRTRGDINVDQLKKQAQAQAIANYEKQYGHM